VTRVAVLASGRGSNLQALLDNVRWGRLLAQIAVVISDRAQAPALERARQAGVPAVFCDPRGRPREEHDRAMLRVCEAHGVEVVALAGYMRLLSASFVAAFPCRILNVHPSLLPAFPGLDAQRQAFDHGVKVTGATVHLVDAGLDTGPILLQEAVPVLDSDTVESLSHRILDAEHRIYPRALDLLLSGRFRVQGRRALLEGNAEEIRTYP
jgi:phosphoribosylglycinamide formyltransferase-1